ncbi:hypothetical protein BT67DRAFT_34637 [Trichocladium antarcticum]|uniref:Uncharacterized protein n=1 Tax=Trichocladium antarcticum TaxID=1450529 RepID=A0AAN6UJH4_9PEZI|nr:hypothetical protein BT67DRAFT_34637 [Trichocladium antarcticum]
MRQDDRRLADVRSSVSSCPRLVGVCRHHKDKLPSDLLEPLGGRFRYSEVLLRLGIRRMRFLRSCTMVSSSLWSTSVSGSRKRIWLRWTAMMLEASNIWTLPWIMKPRLQASRSRGRKASYFISLMSSSPPRRHWSSTWSSKGSLAQKSRVASSHSDAILSAI